MSRSQSHRHRFAVLNPGFLASCGYKLCLIKVDVPRENLDEFLSDFSDVECFITNGQFDVLLRSFSQEDLLSPRIEEFFVRKGIRDTKRIKESLSQVWICDRIDKYEGVLLRTDDRKSSPIESMDLQLVQRLLADWDSNEKLRLQLIKEGILLRAPYNPAAGNFLERTFIYVQLPEKYRRWLNASASDAADMLARDRRVIGLYWAATTARFDCVIEYTPTSAAELSRFVRHKLAEHWGGSIETDTTIILESIHHQAHISKNLLQMLSSHVSKNSASKIPVNAPALDREIQAHLEMFCGDVDMRLYRRLDHSRKNHLLTLFSDWKSRLHRILSLLQQVGGNNRIEGDVRSAFTDAIRFILSPEEHVMRSFANHLGGWLECLACVFLERRAFAILESRVDLILQIMRLPDSKQINPREQTFTHKATAAQIDNYYKLWDSHYPQLPILEKSWRDRWINYRQDLLNPAKHLRKEPRIDERLISEGLHLLEGILAAFQNKGVMLQDISQPSPTPNITTE